jgi:nucleoside-diphosphate-sugar epimerase
MYRFKYLALDLLIASSSFIISYLLVFPDFLERYNASVYIKYFFLFFLVNCAVNLKLKNYQTIYKFFSIVDVIKLLINIIISNFVFYIAIFFIDRLSQIPRSFVLINIFINLLGFFSIRLLGYIKNNDYKNKKENKLTKRLLIIGSIDECNAYIKIKKFLNSDELILGIIAKDEKIIKGHLRGFSILGNINNLRNIFNQIENKIDKIILLSDLNYEDIEFLYKKRLDNYQITRLNLNDDIITSEKKINIEDLLGRNKNKIFDDNLNDVLENKIILVTGGAGSIGKEIVKQLLNYKINRIICVDNSEYNIFKLNEEIQDHFNYKKCIIKLCDIKINNHIKNIVKDYIPNIIFHAAAIKHVSLAEENPHFALETNLIGTKNVLESVNEINGFEAFILISTDKAVNPTSFMGLTKYLCERFVQNFRNVSKFNLAFVRFGNVLSSAGSVLPIFENRIKERKNLLVTHENVERYFMLPEEAVSLVLQAFKVLSVNNLKFSSFLLNMGKPIKILDLAKKMLILNNLKEGKDINIEITGLKRGEKLSEELFYSLEKPKNLNNGDILQLEIIKNYQEFNSEIFSLINNYTNLNKKDLVEKCYSIFKKQNLE